MNLIKPNSWLTTLYLYGHVGISDAETKRMLAQADKIAALENFDELWDLVLFFW